MRSFTNYVTHFLLFFDHPPTNSNTLVIIFLMTYNTRVYYSNAFTNHNLPQLHYVICEWPLMFRVSLEIYENILTDIKMSIDDLANLIQILSKYHE